MSGSRIGLVLLAIVAIAAAGPSGATESSIEIQLEPREFGIEDVTHLTVRIIEPTGTPEVDLGELVNLEVVSGPSTKTEFSWINGASTRAISFSYVLQGLEVGEASLGPVAVQLEDEKLEGDLVAANVVPGSVAPQRRGRRDPFGADPFEEFFGRRQPARAAQVVLRQMISQRQVALGQTVMATIVLDTTAGAPDGFEWVTPPAFPGWWAQRVEPPERITAEVVELEGVRYNRFVVARNVLVPLKTGTLSIPAISARIGFRSQSVFGPQQVVERSSRDATIQVTARPAAVEGFAGAVGNLRYRASIEPEVIEFGESAVVTIELRGNGNLPLVEAPAIWPSSADCETYPPEEDSSFSVDEKGIHGSRSWSTTVVPRVAGELVLEAVDLAVFDPKSSSYVRQTVGPLALEVRAPQPTPVPEPVITDAEGPQIPRIDPTGPVIESPAAGFPSWGLIVGALLIGALVGGLLPLLAARRRRSALPPRSNGESPADRARVLQVALERWWLDARTKTRGRALEGEMDELRRQLEAIRFAPGRADHTETVIDLEDRLRRLMRRA